LDDLDRTGTVPVGSAFASRLEIALALGEYQSWHYQSVRAEGRRATEPQLCGRQTMAPGGWQAPSYATSYRCTGHRIHICAISGPAIG
jgi:hypothetical protein